MTRNRIIGKGELLFLFIIYMVGVYFRLVPRLAIDSHLLTMNADIWARISKAQYFLDHGRLPLYSIRYLAYGKVPFWYPPLAPIFFAVLSRISHLDIPTVTSRLIPFFEALTPLSLYFLASFLFTRPIAVLATAILCLTPSFVYWSGIATPQSFTLFMLPIYILIWVDYLKKREGLTAKSRLLRLGMLGLFLSINLLTHLTYFLALIVLFLVNLALVIEEKYKLSAYLDLFIAFIISQLLTIWWWLPKNLYWWYTKALVTSTSVELTYVQQLEEYGWITSLLGMASLLFLIIYIAWPKKEKEKYLILALLWLFFPLIEVNNENILKLLNRLDLMWSSVFKPLEGFRFNCFLAQPMSLISAIFVFKIIRKPSHKLWANGLKFLFILLLFSLLVRDIHYKYNFYGRIRNAGITMEEYNAALWFRNNSEPNDRIIADYYGEQMFAGVCGGRALLGGMFPLRVKIPGILPYIVQPCVVRDDVYTIYSTKDPREASDLMVKYGCTHIFYSDRISRYGGFASKYKKGFGVDIDKEKFHDPAYFEEVYTKFGNTIIKLHN